MKINDPRAGRLIESFTLVFKGDIRAFKQNPLTTETPWGIPHSVAMGDALEELDELRGIPTKLLDVEITALPSADHGEK